MSPTVALVFIALVEAIVIAVLSYLILRLLDEAAKERQDLYNRIQAGSLEDYSKVSGNGRPPPKGGNMVTAGLRKAARKDGLKAGEA